MTLKPIIPNDRAVEFNRQGISWTFKCPQRCLNVVGAFKRNHEKLNGFLLKRAKANLSQGLTGGLQHQEFGQLGYWAIRTD